MSKQTDEEIIRRARARALLTAAPDCNNPPRFIIVCNVGCVTVSDDAPRTPNYDWRWAETRPEGMRGPSIEFARGEDESGADFTKRVLDSLPAVPREGVCAIATFYSPNIPEGNCPFIDTGDSETPAKI
jgi:hypothetical protein